MNPYASFLGGNDPIEVIGKTAFRLAESIRRRRGAGMLDAPWAAGKWSARQVLAHMADTEIMFAARLRQAIADDNHVIQPFDQNAWSTNYATVDVAAAQTAFTALRAWNIEFIKAQPKAAWSKQLTHPERGTMTFRTLVETMAGHDLNHLSQIA